MENGHGWRVFITFDVSMNLALRVQILQPLQYLPQYSSYVSLFKRSWTELECVGMTNKSEK